MDLAGTLRVDPAYLCCPSPGPLVNLPVTLSKMKYGARLSKTLKLLDEAIYDQRAVYLSYTFNLAIFFIGFTLISLKNCI